MPDNHTSTNDINNIILQELRASQNKSDRLHDAIRETNDSFQTIVKDIPRLRDVETKIGNVENKNYKLEEKLLHLENHNNKHCGLLEGKDGLLMKIVNIENKLNGLADVVTKMQTNSFSTPDRLLFIFGFIISNIITFFIAKYFK